jgi:hypothetical protein
VLFKNGGSGSIATGNVLDLIDSADTNGNSLDLESNSTFVVNDADTIQGRLDADHNIKVHGASLILYARTGAAANVISGIGTSKPTVTFSDDGFYNGYLYIETTGNSGYATANANFVFNSGGYYCPYYFSGVGTGGSDLLAALSSLGTVTFNTGSVVDLDNRNSTQGGRGLTSAVRWRVPSGRRDTMLTSSRKVPTPCRDAGGLALRPIRRSE